jgi:anti-anti-sigma factor
MFELTHAVRGGVLVLRPKGRIDSATSAAFSSGVASLARDGIVHMVLDLAGLDYISSAGLRVVLTAAKAAKEAGGAMTLCGVRGNVAQVIAISGFDKVLGAHADEAAALASFADSR